MTATVDRDYAKCCFGRLDVRTGTRIVATFFIGFSVVSVFITMYSMNTEIPNIYPMSYTASTFLLECLILYFNICLRKATYDKNIEIIKHCLVIYLMIMYTLFYIGIMQAFTYRNMPISLIYGLIVGYFLSILRNFYRDEMEKYTVADGNISVVLPQPALNGHRFPV